MTTGSCSLLYVACVKYCVIMKITQVGRMNFFSQTGGQSAALIENSSTIYFNLVAISSNQTEGNRKQNRQLSFRCPYTARDHSDITILKCS